MLTAIAINLFVEVRHNINIGRRILIFFLLLELHVPFSLTQDSVSVSE